MAARGKTTAMASGSSAGSVRPGPQLLCLSLHGSDKIRVMDLAANSIAALRALIQASWKYGIQSEGLYGISYQFKLRGRPWDGKSEQANLARRLVACVLGFLLQQGWVLRVASDLSTCVWDKDTFYFKQQEQPDPGARVCAVSFHRSDTIRVVSGPPEVAQVVRASIHNFWYRGLQRESLHYGEPEFKLLGNPWTGSGTESMQTRMFVGQLIEALDRAGWLVYASVDISSRRASSDSNIDDPDSWILRSKPLPQADQSPTIGFPAQKQAAHKYF